MNQETDKIIAFSVTQVTAAGNSNRMEKREFQKTLNVVRENDIVEKKLITDRNMQIRRWMKEDEPQID